MSTFQHPALALGALSASLLLGAGLSGPLAVDAAEVESRLMSLALCDKIPDDGVRDLKSLIDAGMVALRRPEAEAYIVLLGSDSSALDPLSAAVENLKIVCELG